MKTSTALVVSLLLLFTMQVSRASRDAAPRDAASIAAPGDDCGGEPCEAVLRGFRAFVERAPDHLGGNGRACADCHMPLQAFQLSPASVEARYQWLQWRRLRHPDADDPLFRPIDANDFRINGEHASDYSNLRQHALVRVTLPLPANVKLVDPITGLPSTDTIVDVWRSVPTVNDVALTGPDDGAAWARGPNPSGGFQLDARLLSLQEQAQSAFTSHAGTVAPASQDLLDDLASFQRVLFTSAAVRALADAVRAGSPLPDPDRKLTALQQNGKVVFERACAHCHGGPGQSTPRAPIVRYHDIATQCPRPVDTVMPARFAFAPCAPLVAATTRTYEFTQANGTTMRRTSSDPGRALLTGVVGGPPALDDWNKFDTPGLRGLSKTAPYFHNNSAASLEAVVDHYIEFFKRVRANAPPGVIPPVATTDGINFDRAPTVEERAALLAYLRQL